MGGSTPPPPVSQPSPPMAATPATGSTGLMPVGEAEVKQLPERLPEVTRPVTLTGTTAGQTADGSTRVRTSSGELVLKLATPLPPDRPVTVQIAPAPRVPTALAAAPANLPVAGPTPVPAAAPTTVLLPPQAGQPSGNSAASLLTPSTSQPVNQPVSAPRLGASLTQGLFNSLPPVTTAPATTAKPDISGISIGLRATVLMQVGSNSPQQPATTAPAVILSGTQTAAQTVAADWPLARPGTLVPAQVLAAASRPPSSAPGSVATSGPSMPMGASPPSTQPAGPGTPPAPASTAAAAPATAATPAGLLAGAALSGTDTAKPDTIQKLGGDAAHPGAHSKADPAQGRPPPPQTSTSPQALSQIGPQNKGQAQPAPAPLASGQAIPTPAPVAPPPAQPPVTAPESLPALPQATLKNAGQPATKPDSSQTAPLPATVPSTPVIPARTSSILPTPAPANPASGTLTAQPAGAPPASESTVPTPQPLARPQGQTINQDPVLTQGSRLALRLIAITPQPSAPTGTPTPAATTDPIDQATPLMDGRQMIRGHAVGTTPSGHAVLATPQGMLALMAPVRLPVGAMVTAEIGGLPPHPGIAPELATSGPLTDLDWPAMRQLIAVLSGIDRGMAQSLLTSIVPQPNRKLGAAVTFLLSALRGGDARGWLGGDVAQALEHHGQLQLLEQLERDFKGQRDALENPLSGDWRPYSLPFVDATGQHLLRLHVRPIHGDEQGTGGQRDDNKGSRFLIDITLSRLGPIQLDGLVRSGRFDLILRSHQPLEPEVRANLIEVFRNSLETVGFSGGLGFQSGAKSWVRLIRSGASGGGPVTA